MEPLVVTTASVPDGTAGAAYSQTLAATGGTAPYTWSLVSGTLPAGLSLTMATGVISGTPTTAQAESFTVRATDSQGTPETADQALSITVSAAVSGNVTLQDGLNGYAGTADTWLNSDVPTTNFGADETAHLQYNTADRQVMYFDLSSIPAGATVDGATLSVYAYNVTGGTPNVAAYRVITAWDEMQATFNNATTVAPWGTPGLASGTDYAATAVANSGNVAAAGWMNFDVTTLAGQWVGGTYANRGVMLRETTAGHLYTYMSEYTADTTRRPKLYVTYTVPIEPVDVTTTSLPGGAVGSSLQPDGRRDGRRRAICMVRHSRQPAGGTEPQRVDRSYYGDADRGGDGEFHGPGNGQPGDAGYGQPGAVDIGGTTGLTPARTARSSAWASWRTARADTRRRTSARCGCTSTTAARGSR